jgi:hypothetical protein
MKTHPLNLCPSCLYNNTCVLTTLKSQVWSCSEYDEDNHKDDLLFSLDKTNKKESQPQLVLA